MLEIQKFSSSSGVDDPSTSLDCVGSNVRRCSGSFSRLHGNKYHSLVKLFKMVVRRTHCCQHLRLLDKHCAVPELYDTGKSSTSFKGNESKKNVPEKSHGFNTANCEETEPSLKQILSLRSQVVSFILAVIWSIVPTELLGTSSNWRMLRRNIASKQAQKYASVEMHKGSRRLDDATYVLRRTSEKLDLLVFFMSSRPLVQANFYVTETEQGNQDLYYYRKSVWEKLINNAVACLKDLGYRDLDDVNLGCPNKYESSLCH
ncbi:telomerase reverse transcriptase-like [Castanea sativa]|uniref:telomerase reverse transcriptase-like n=1 Tax=Castanea sativa TaxID=21020 RepID=UPI003F64C4A9